MRHKIRRLALLAVLMGGFFVPAHAQSTAPVLLPGGCGTGNMTNSLSYPTIDSSGRWCNSASSSANMATAQISVGATATSVAAARVGRSSVTVANNGTVDTFCGAAGVTITTGALLVGTKGATLTIPTQAAVFCVVATGTETVTVLETY